MRAMLRAQRRFATFAWLVLAYNVAVVLWGAYVRATGSGAGCGAHWPLCDGEVVPRIASTAMLIEYSHRLSSGLALVLAGVLLWWARRAFPRGDAVRRSATAVVILTLTEALVGAGLVLFRLVATDASATRTAAMAIHLCNTFLLLGALTVTATRAGADEPPHRLPGPLAVLLGFAFGGVLLVAMAGAVTALGDTLFPPRAGEAALAASASATAHFLVRLRVIHPIIALTVSGYLVVLAGMLPETCRRQAWTLVILVVVQLVAGVATVVLRAPVFMQLVHLALADLVWIALVIAADRARFAALATAPATLRRHAA